MGHKCCKMKVVYLVKHVAALRERQKPLCRDKLLVLDIRIRKLDQGGHMRGSQTILYIH